MEEEWLEHSHNQTNLTNNANCNENDDNFDRAHYEKLLKDKDAEIAALKSTIENQNRIIAGFKFNLSSFKNSDDKVKHFTGLPTFTALNIVFDFTKNGIITYSSTMTKEETFLLVLIRLRLNICFKTLGFLFGVCASTACKYFYSGLYSLYQQLKGLIKWPSQQMLENNTPAKFSKAFGRPITIIIDCFEIFTEKPGTKDAVVKMYSSYKHHYTAKVLIGITPFGSISFVSKPYTGRTSDKFITENSSFLDNIKSGSCIFLYTWYIFFNLISQISGDLVLADRGFTIKKSIEDKGADLRVPDSSSKKRQLSSTSIERTRALASIRNEVERDIGALRGKYQVLNGPVPITMMEHYHNGQNVLHMVLVVCCSLINLCPTIIK